MTTTGTAPATPVLQWTGGEQLPEEMRAGFLGPGAPFELATEEVLGHPVPVFRQRPRSLAELIGNAASHGDRPFLIGPSTTLRFDQLPDAVNAAGARLARASAQPGSRVLIAGQTSSELVLTVLGAMAQGSIAVMANPRWTASELHHACDSTEPALIVGDPDVIERTDRDGAAGGIPAITLADLHSGPDPATPRTDLVGTDEDAPCSIMFTSGTTGRPRGALLSQRNMIHFCLSTALTSLARGLSTGVSPGTSAQPTVIASAPLFHVSGLLGQLVNSVAWGLTLVVAPPGRWDADTHLALTEAHGVTTWSLVPTQLWRIVDHPDLDRYDLSSLTTIGGGGSTFPPELLRQVGERLPHVRAGLRIGYGMTEAAGTLTLLEPPIAPHELGSVGRAVAGAEVEVRDSEGRPLPAGRIGQIWARSASIFLGYWGDPEATGAALDAQRWYATGDFGRIDGDVLHLESRLRDLIIRGGENIYPIEIENRLVEHPQIAAAAVVGLPHRTLGQEVKAVVVPADGADLDDDEVREWVAASLARYKVPTVVEQRDELPVNHLGKVLKHLLD